MNGHDLQLEDGDLLLPDGIVERGLVLIRGGKIVYAGTRDGLKGPIRAGTTRVDVSNHWVCPALVELHIHGCGGSSFHDPQDRYFLDAARFLSSRGVGVFLPTVIPDESTLRSLTDAVERFADRGRVPGIYLEGPFIGSRLLVKDVVYRMHRYQGIPLHSAVAMAATNPLRLLGLERKGTLAEGQDADVSVFDRVFETCLLQVVEGRVLHSRLGELIQEGENVCC